MDLDIKVIIQLYKEEIAKLQNENILLKAQLIQLNNNKPIEESGDNE